MSLSIHMRNYCEDLIRGLTFLKYRKISIICQVENKDYKSILPPEYSLNQPLLFISITTLCSLLFAAPTPLHPQFPLGPSSYSLAFCKIKYTPIRQSSSCLPWHLLPEVENAGPHKTYTEIFIIALFIIGETWKQPQYPSVTEGLNSCPIQKMEYYSVFKRNELSNHD